MDPNAALKSALSSAKLIVRSTELEEGDEGWLDVFSRAEVGEDLAEQVVDLDEWLRKGGFLPEAWQRPSPAGVQEYSLPAKSGLGAKEALRIVATVHPTKALEGLWRLLCHTVPGEYGTVVFTPVTALELLALATRALYPDPRAEDRCEVCGARTHERHAAICPWSRS